MRRDYKNILLSFSLILAGCSSSEIVLDTMDSNPMYVASSSATAMASPRMLQAPLKEFNTERYHNIEENGFKQVATAPLSTVSIDVDTASYTNVVRMIDKEGELPPKGAVRIEEMINYFDYEYPQPGANATNPFSLTTELMSAPWNKKNKLLLVGLQAKKIAKKDLPPSNFVALVDLSGSMRDSLLLVKQSLKFLVEQLDEKDHLSIVGYADGVGLMLKPTNCKNKQAINSAIDSLVAYGGTDGEAGIEFAYKQAKENFLTQGNNRVLLFTDGDFNIGKTSESEIVDIIKKERESGVYLSVIAYGYGNFNDAAMEQMADHGNGNFNYINDILDARKVFTEELSGTLYTLGKDVKFQLEFNPAFVDEYRLIGYENRKLNDEDFNDDTKDAGEIGVGNSVTFLYELVEANTTTQQAKVDNLKYQSKVLNKETKVLKEIATIKMRYKNNDSNQSKLLSKVVKSDEKASQNIRFASSVAMYGMLLTESQYLNSANYDNVLTLAKANKGKDENGYRAFFIRLVEKSKLLTPEQPIALEDYAFESLEPIYFEKNRFHLNEKSKEKLIVMTELFKKHLKPEQIIRIVGNRDKMGSEEYNFVLGLKMANSVKQFLVSLGINENQTIIISNGEKNPVCTEDTPECYNKNRRVELEILD